MSAINTAILKAAALIGPIGKEANSNLKFKFRGIDAVMNRASKVFSEVGIFVTPHVQRHEVTVRKTSSGGDTYNHTMLVQFTFHCSGDDSTVSCVVAGEASDSGDKGASKAMAIALKYAMFITLMIPLEVTDDPDTYDSLAEPKASVTKPGDITPTAVQICEAFESCNTPEEFKAASSLAAAAWSRLTEPQRATLKSLREATKKRVEA